MTRIHNIGHIHNTNFAQSQFSMSYPQKMHFLTNWEFTFFWKYLVCGFKIEISEYPTKVLYVTYSPYKYELHRTKTHEIRAKYFLPFFFPVTVGGSSDFLKRCNMVRNGKFGSCRYVLHHLWMCYGLYIIFRHNINLHHFPLFCLWIFSFWHRNVGEEFFRMSFWLFFG